MNDNYNVEMERIMKKMNDDYNKVQFTIILKNNPTKFQLIDLYWYFVNEKSQKIKVRKGEMIFILNNLLDSNKDSKTITINPIELLICMMI